MSALANLQQILSESTCIVGLGNRLRGDDGVGVMIAETLKNHAASGHGHQVVEAEDVIENYVFQLAEGSAENILLVDAVKMPDTAVGSVVFGRLEELENGSDYSTHKLALATSASILRQYGKQVWLLGLVAHDVDYGATLSPQMAESAQRVIDFIRLARST